METKTLKLFLIFTFMVLTLFAVKNTVNAASGNITVSPRSITLSINETFPVSIIIDGGGTNFNAAKGIVSVSPNLRIESLTIGNCDFAFVTTPTKENPSFAGAILGGSSNRCTLYTLRLKPLATGNGTITLTNASLKAQKGASEILSFAQDGSYTISPSAGSDTNTVMDLIPTEAPIIASGIRLYEVLYSVPLTNDLSPSQVKIVMDPSSPNPVIASPLLSANSSVATAKFEKVTQGVHTFEATYNGKSVSKQIVNVQGNNKKLEFGVSTQNQKTMILWYLVGAIVLITLIAVSIFIYLLKHKSIQRFE